MLGFAIESSTLIENPVIDLNRYCKEKLDLPVSEVEPSWKPTASLEKQGIPNFTAKITPTVKISTKVIPKKTQDIITDKAKKKLISKVKTKTKASTGAELRKKARELLDDDPNLWMGNQEKKK